MSGLVSLVVPVFNEELGLAEFHRSLVEVLDALPTSTFEIIYVDDGSRDRSVDVVARLAEDDSRVRSLRLSRNFGKEIATTAGIHNAAGDAIILIDADGQHPVELIPRLLERWRAGSRVVVGVRTAHHRERFMKRLCSRAFYAFFNRLTGARLEPGATDFRLIDRAVRAEFVRMTEHRRITRALVDWLGFERDRIEFVANPRIAGEASYSFGKLCRLAVDSFVSLSTSPLYLASYLGTGIVALSSLLGVFLLGDVVTGDPLHVHPTGSAYLILLVLFLVGIVLVSQGIIGLYLSHIHAETQNRPLYVLLDEEPRGATVTRFPQQIARLAG